MGLLVAAGVVENYHTASRVGEQSCVWIAGESAIALQCQPKHMLQFRAILQIHPEILGDVYNHKKLYIWCQIISE